MRTFWPSLFFVLLCFLSLLGALWLRSGTSASPFAMLDLAVRQVLNIFDELADRPYEYAEKQPHTAGSELSAGIDRLSSTLSEKSPFSFLDHTAGDGAVCGRPPSKSRSDTNAQIVYKWIDENGQTHMSDKRPEGYIASVVDLGMSKQDFTYEIIPDGVTPPLEFQGQLAAGSKRMYDTWHFFLGESNLRQSRIQLLLMGDPNRFDAYYANASPGSNKVAGFYSMSKNQAVVKYDANNPARNLGTSFHEISHLITAAHLGPTPPWLTEGLAEYFETMQVQGQGGTIHLSLLKTRSLPQFPKLPHLIYAAIRV